MARPLGVLLEKNNGGTRGLHVELYTQLCEEDEDFEEDSSPLRIRIPPTEKRAKLTPRPSPPGPFRLHTQMKDTV